MNTTIFSIINNIIVLTKFKIQYYTHTARRAGSDGSMCASGSAGLGFDPRQVSKFYLKIFNLGARRGGDIHFLIARLYIAVLD